MASVMQAHPNQLTFMKHGDDESVICLLVVSTGFDIQISNASYGHRNHYTWWACVAIHQLHHIGNHDVDCLNRDHWEETIAKLWLNYAVLPLTGSRQTLSSRWRYSFFFAMSFPGNVATSTCVSGMWGSDFNSGAVNLCPPHIWRWLTLGICQQITNDCVSRQLGIAYIAHLECHSLLQGKVWIDWFCAS